MDCRNYIPMEKLSFRFRYFCFIDTKEYLADALFIKHKVRVCFEQEAEKAGTDYIFVFCKVRKRDVDRFLNALGDLKTKMLLLGHPDYLNYCENVQNRIAAQR